MKGLPVESFLLPDAIFFVLFSILISILILQGVFFPSIDFLEHLEVNGTD